MKRILAIATVALLLGCAGVRAPQPAPVPVPGEPLLQLPPASLGAPLSLAQHLDIDAHGERRSVDALLEADAASVRLALLQFGQPVARLEWDGRELHEQRLPGVPAQLRADRILSELQLVQWPAAAVRGGLPDGWTLRETGDGAGRVRELMQGDAVVIRVRYPSPGVAELEHLRDGYRLHIESTAADGA